MVSCCWTSFMFAGYIYASLWCVNGRYHPYITHQHMVTSRTIKKDDSQSNTCYILIVWIQDPLLSDVWIHHIILFMHSQIADGEIPHFLRSPSSWTDYTAYIYMYILHMYVSYHILSIWSSPGFNPACQQERWKMWQMPCAASVCCACSDAQFDRGLTGVSNNSTDGNITSKSTSIKNWVLLPMKCLSHFLYPNFRDHLSWWAQPSTGCISWIFLVYSWANMANHRTTWRIFLHSHG